MFILIEKNIKKNINEEYILIKFNMNEYIELFLWLIEIKNKIIGYINKNINEYYFHLFLILIK